MDAINDLQTLQAEVDALREALGSEFQGIDIDIDLSDLPLPSSTTTTTDHVAGPSTSAAAAPPSQPEQQPLQQQSKQPLATHPLQQPPATRADKITAIKHALHANQALQQRLNAISSSINSAQDRLQNIRERGQTALTKQPLVLRNINGNIGVGGGTMMAIDTDTVSNRGGMMPFSPSSMQIKRYGFWNTYFQHRYQQQRFQDLLEEQRKEREGGDRYQQQQQQLIRYQQQHPPPPPPPPNPHHTIIKSMLQVLPMTFKRGPWSEEEKKKLRQSVLVSVQEFKLNQALDSFKAALHTTNNSDSDSDSDNGRRKKRNTKQHQKTHMDPIQYETTIKAPIEALTEHSPEVEQVAAEFSDTDWEMVAVRAGLNVNVRPPQDCKIQWMNVLRPSVRSSSEEYTGGEDVALFRAVQEYNNNNNNSMIHSDNEDGTGIATDIATATTNNNNKNKWQWIADKVGTGRTALSCLKRYIALGPDYHYHHVQVPPGSGGGEFTEQDYKRLVDLVQKHGTVWKRVADDFNNGSGRYTGSQLMHYFRKWEQGYSGGTSTGAGAGDKEGGVVVGEGGGRGGEEPLVGQSPQPQLQQQPVVVGSKKGKWSSEEDELLHKAVALHGRKWSKVARLVPGRTDIQCRERFVNVLDPGVNFKYFTVKEEKKLRGLVRKNIVAGSGQVKWAAVAAEMPGRTDKQCSVKWASMVGKEKKAVEKEREEEEEEEKEEEEGEGRVGSGKKKKKKREREGKGKEPADGNEEEEEDGDGEITKMGRGERRRKKIVKH